MAQEAMAQVEEAKAPVKEAEELLRSAEGLRARESGEAVGQKLKAEAKKLKFGTLEALCEERFLRALAEDEPLPAAEQQPPEEAWKAELKRIEQRNTDLKREIASFISSLCAKLPAARSQATSLAEQADSLTALEEEVSRDAPTTDSESDLKFLESEVQQLREQVGSTEQEAEQLANENAEAERDVEAAENETSQITSELTSLRALESGIRSSKELLGEAHQALERSNDQYGWLSQLTGVSIADVTAGSVTVRYDGDCGTYDITVAFEPGTKRIADIRTSPDNAPVHDILASGKEQPQNGLQFAIRETLARVVAATRRQQALRHAKKQGVSVAQATKGTKLQIALSGDCVVTVDAPLDWPNTGSELEVIGVRCNGMRRSLRQQLADEINMSDAVSGDLEQLAGALEERKASLLQEWSQRPSTPGSAVRA